MTRLQEVRRVRVQVIYFLSSHVGRYQNSDWIQLEFKCVAFVLMFLYGIKKKKVSFGLS